MNIQQRVAAYRACLILSQFLPMLSDAMDDLMESDPALHAQLLPDFHAMKDFRETAIGAYQSTIALDGMAAVEYLLKQVSEATLDEIEWFINGDHLAYRRDGLPQLIDNEWARREKEAEEQERDALRRWNRLTEDG
ncbi:MAG: hypothetical protein AAGK74_00305 [Chloroflexota bacterium]